MVFTCFPSIYNNVCISLIIPFFSHIQSQECVISAIQISNWTTFQAQLENPTYSPYLEILTFVPYAKFFFAPKVLFTISSTCGLDSLGAISLWLPQNPGFSQVAPRPPWAPLNPQEPLRHRLPQYPRHAMHSQWNFHYSVTTGCSSGHDPGNFYS